MHKNKSNGSTASTEKRKQGRPKADQTGKTIGFYANPKTVEMVDQFFVDFPNLNKSDIFNEIVYQALPRLRKKHQAAQI
jgi:hypothetical protein